MALLPAYYTSNNTKKRKKSKPSSASIKHENWLKAQGIHISQIKGKKQVDSKWKVNYIESLKVDRDDYVSAGMSGSASACADKSIMTNLHKEPEHVRKEILKKANRVAIAYNKGPLMLMIDSDDITQIGSKSRR